MQNATIKMHVIKRLQVYYSKKNCFETSKARSKTADAEYGEVLIYARIYVNFR